MLALIMLDVVVLTVQGARSQAEPRPSGWFNTWEDWVLFVLFVLFTLEMFARIVVSGFLLDPYTAATLRSASGALSSKPGPTSTVHCSTNPSSGPPMADRSTAARLRGARIKISATMALSGSKGSVGSQTGLTGKRAEVGEDGTLYDSQDEDDDDNMYSIAPLNSSPTHTGPAPGRPTPSPSRRGPSSTQPFASSRSNFLQPPSSSSSRADGLHPSMETSASASGVELPFQLSLDKQRRLHSLGRPYLRTSWHRIDLLAIVSFWIMFCLAITGNESTADRHMFIFRALSTMRAGRLLLVSSGTAVSAQSSTDMCLIVSFVLTN